MDNHFIDCSPSLGKGTVRSVGFPIFFGFMRAKKDGPVRWSICRTVVFSQWLTRRV